MATSAFGSPFSSGRSSGAGYGTPLGEAAGRSPERQEYIDNRRSELEAERAARKLETEGASYPTNAEERETKNFEKEVEDRIKAEEKAAAEKAAAEKAAAEKAAAEKAAAEKAAAEKAKRDRDAAAKGETQTGVLEAPPPTPTPEAGNQPANPTAPTTPKANPEQLRARQAVAKNLRAALGADEGEDRDAMIEGARKDAAAAGVSEDAFNSFLAREKAQPPLGTYGRPTQEQIAARQDAANRIKAGIRSGDPNIISAAKEDAIIAGVPMGRAWEFESNQAQELARRGEIQPGATFGKSGNLDAYYASQTEKSRGIPLGYRSGKSVPIAPDWRIHTRLNRLVNRRTYEGDQDRSISPEAAAMRFAEATGRKLAFNRPLEYIQQQQDLRDLEQRAIRNNQPLGTNLYGFGSR